MARERGYPEIVLNTLHKEGHRLTMARTRIAQILDKADEPLNAYEIQKRLLEDGTRADVNTVYRVLETLEKHNLVVLVGLKGSDRYLAKRFPGPAIIVIDNQNISLYSKDTCPSRYLKVLDTLKEELGEFPAKISIHR